jgi:5-methylcytosine-specific restriction endonuclease McrBC GTP-binding regulatory subunit McrB
MGTISELEQLRARTDRELAALIDRELDRGRDAEARKLLPKVYNLGERLRLERRLHELSEPERPRLRAAAG